MNVRKHPALILKPSAHLQSSRQNQGELNHHSFALARFFSKLLEQLAKHFGIRGPHRWFLLSVELAKELGLFEEPEKRGVRRSVTDDEQRELVEKVDAINAERGRGIEDAVQILQQREPKYRKTERDAKSMKSKAKNPLATRYYEAAKKFKPPSWSLWGGHLRKKSTTKD